MADILAARQAGILLPISSLPSRHGIGDMGPGAHSLLPHLAKAGVRVWQILPLNPLGFGNSPYQPYSSFAGDPIYLNLDALGVSAPDYKKTATRVDYEAVRAFKEPYLKKAFEKFVPDEGYETFIQQKWVKDYAVFITFKKHNDMRCWIEWPAAMKNWAYEHAVDLAEYAEDIRYEMFLQYEFYRQWMALKNAANELGISVMGDIPFYVGIDSLDVWSGKENFLLETDGRPTFIAGVPPDYFSATGQRWGNPIYDWGHMQKTNFAFWLERLRANSQLFDIIRIDHFRAFDTYWSIPGENPTAEFGEWLEAPGYEFFDTVREVLPSLNIVAEDLGDLRDEVHELRDHYDLMGMKIVQFFLSPGDSMKHDGDEKESAIIYTGTHDNQTILGFYKSRTADERRAYRKAFMQAGYKKGSLSEKFARFALDDAARLAIIPAQDIIGLDDCARLNTPGTVGSPNWEWRMDSHYPLLKGLKAFKRAIKLSGRTKE